MIATASRSQGLPQSRTEVRAILAPSQPIRKRRFIHTWISPFLSTCTGHRECTTETHPRHHQGRRSDLATTSTAFAREVQTQQPMKARRIQSYVLVQLTFTDDLFLFACSYTGVLFFSSSRHLFKYRSACSRMCKTFADHPGTQRWSSGA